MVKWGVKLGYLQLEQFMEYATLSVIERTVMYWHCKKKSQWLKKGSNLQWGIYSGSKVADAKVDSLLLKCIDCIINLKVTKLRFKPKTISKPHTTSWFALPQCWISWNSHTKLSYWWDNHMRMSLKKYTIIDETNCQSC